MKKLISIKSISILVLALLVVLGTAWAAGSDPVYGSGTAKLNLWTGAAIGEAILIIGGEEFTASLAVQITSQVLSDEGVIHATAMHTFTLPGGTIITSDKEVINTDGTLNANLTITSGTGAFEGASGVLSGHGQVQFPAQSEEPPIADVCYKIRGVISR